MSLLRMAADEPRAFARAIADETRADFLRSIRNSAQRVRLRPNTDAWGGEVCEWVVSMLDKRIRKLESTASA
jgi:hypothetical protein